MMFLMVLSSSGLSDYARARRFTLTLLSLKPEDGASRFDLVVLYVCFASPRLRRRGLVDAPLPGFNWFMDLCPNVARTFLDHSAGSRRFRGCTETRR